MEDVICDVLEKALCDLREKGAPCAAIAAGLIATASEVLANTIPPHAVMQAHAAYMNTLRANMPEVTNVKPH